MKQLWNELVARLSGAGDTIWTFGLRLILGYEYLESGITKYQGNNWFGSIQDQFPYPFSQFPAEISWQMATWGEIIGGIALILGLGTRFFAFSLIVITIVATTAVHWPAEWSSLSELWRGYAISGDGYGNYKLPLLFYLMFLPLLFHGGGKLSVDHLIRKVINNPVPPAAEGLQSWGLVLFLLGAPALLLHWPWGLSLVVVGLILAFLGRNSRAH